MSRYFTLTYYKQPDGKYNEVGEIKKRIKTRDLQMCNVILDFRDQDVLKCTMNGQTVKTDNTWETVLGYYSQYHGDTFARLLKENNVEEMEKREDDSS